MEDPATRQTIAHIADGTAEDARLAVDAAAGQLRYWSALPPRHRSELLLRVWELMHRDIDQLSALIALENGKSTSYARNEVGYAAEYFRWYAEEAVRPGGNYGTAPAGGSRTVVTHRPAGVAELVTPRNFPAAMATRKIAPALAAGCTVVFKPAAETPLTALAIVRLAQEGGIADGVVNVVPGLDAEGIVTAWLEDVRVRKLSFAGSTSVGRKLLRHAAGRVINTSMELGGNAPFVVTSSADIDDAVTGAMLAKLRNGGQACTAANRFYLHADMGGDFTARFGDRTEALRAWPAHAVCDIGPLISAKAVESVTRLVDAVSRGAKVSHLAPAPGGGGYFYPPTVLTNVPVGADVLHEEILGPAAPIVTWDNVDDLVSMANNTEFGFAAYVHAELGEALRIAESLDTGMVGINRGLISDPAAPSGGSKQSGIGREGARQGSSSSWKPSTWPSTGRESQGAQPGPAPRTTTEGTTTVSGSQNAPCDTEPTLDELRSRLRGIQLYMVRMELIMPTADPLAALTPFLREHILWLRDRERDGSLFLSGANRDEEGWDGGGVMILRANSRLDAVTIAQTEPFHREGVRRNSVHGWLLNEGSLRISVHLFDDRYDLS